MRQQCEVQRWTANQAPKLDGEVASARAENGNH
jgi:hypothetical protein